MNNPIANIIGPVSIKHPARSKVGLTHMLSILYHQFIMYSLATRAAADTVLHVLTVRVATPVHNQTHFRIESVVPLESVS